MDNSKKKRAYGLFFIVLCVFRLYTICASAVEWTKRNDLAIAYQISTSSEWYGDLLIRVCLYVWGLKRWMIVFLFPWCIYVIVECFTYISGLVFHQSLNIWWPHTRIAHSHFIQSTVGYRNKISIRFNARNVNHSLSHRQHTFCSMWTNAWMECCYI